MEAKNVEKNLTWQSHDITREKREELLGQKAVTVWFTGLSGAGKSTLANLLEQKLFEQGRHTMLLDGDNVRMGLNKNLGFSKEDRAENIRRVAEAAKLLNDAGIIVLTAFISPYQRERQNAKTIIGDGFYEVFVDTPLAECERRDVKGLYKKARAGEIDFFTGVTDPYEPPEHPNLTVDTTEMSPGECVEFILKNLYNR